MAIKTFATTILLFSWLNLYPCFQMMPSKLYRKSSLSLSDFFDATNNLASSSAWSTVDLAFLRRVDPAEAQGEFFFFFFGGSGALGIGFAQVPKLYAEYQKVQALANGKTKGGPVLEASPLATIGFPESLKISDVQYIIDKIPSIEVILKKGPKKSYIAQMGYLEREGFNAALPADSNPLALYAAFDALAKGGGDLATPTDAEEMIRAWKGKDGLEAFKSAMLLANARKYSAYAVFFFLIALVFDLIIESGANAFL